MNKKPAYSCPAFRDNGNTATGDSKTHKLQVGINNVEYLCAAIASGVIGHYTKNNNIQTIATAVVDQAEAIIEELEKRKLT